MGSCGNRRNPPQHAHANHRITKSLLNFYPFAYLLRVINILCVFTVAIACPEAKLSTALYQIPFSPKQIHWPRPRAKPFIHVLLDQKERKRKKPIKSKPITVRQSAMREYGTPKTVAAPSAPHRAASLPCISHC